CTRRLVCRNLRQQLLFNRVYLERHNRELLRIRKQKTVRVEIPADGVVVLSPIDEGVTVDLQIQPITNSVKPLLRVSIELLGIDKQLRTDYLEIVEIPSVKIRPLIEILS